MGPINQEEAKAKDNKSTKSRKLNWNNNFVFLCKCREKNKELYLKHKVAKNKKQKLSNI